MSEDTTEPTGSEESDAGRPPGAEPSQEVTRPDDAERQERGRAAMDRWSLHKALMEDFDAELEAAKASEDRPPNPDPTAASDPDMP